MADEEEDAPHHFGTAAVLLSHYLHQRRAAAAAERTCVEEAEHQCAEGGAYGEPPCREAEGEGQLGGADGGLAAHEGA